MSLLESNCLSLNWFLSPFHSEVCCSPQVASGESPPPGRKEQSQPEKKDWTPVGPPKEKEREAGDKERDKERERVKEREWVMERAPQAASQGDDFERTPSGRVRRRSAQVAVFHLQEIAEDELAKDWGTKRRIKDDLVPDSKRVRTETPADLTWLPDDDMRPV